MGAHADSLHALEGSVGNCTVYILRSCVSNEKLVLGNVDPTSCITVRLMEI